MVSRLRRVAPKDDLGDGSYFRSAVFISHANPEDNPFALWLGAKLAALGYDVWADVMRLRPGDDWELKLENALRHRSIKVLFVGTRVGAEKPGTRSELQIASSVARTLQDRSFIIPLRLEQHDPPFSITRAHYLEFAKGWALGLKDLVETLEAANVPRGVFESNAIWHELQMLGGRALERRPEQLISNILRLSLPRVTRYFDFTGAINQEATRLRIRETPFGAVPHLRGFLTFADAAAANLHFGDGSVRLVEERATDAFLEQGWTRFGIVSRVASNIAVDIVRQAAETTLQARGLSSYPMASGHLAWWASSDVIAADKVPFAWDGFHGLRQLRGYSETKRVHWHYGISLSPRTLPTPRMFVIPRVVFTEDGRRTVVEPARAHRLRRSFARSWRNARWRDLMLTFLYWLADGSNFVLSTGTTDNATLILPPLSFKTDWSVPDVEDEAIEDETDIDLDLDESQSDDQSWDEYELDD